MGSRSECSRPALALGRCIYSRHGRPRWLHLGDADAIGLADARTLAAEAMLAVARGKDPAAEKRAERGAGTFAELAGRYVEHYAKKHNKSWQQADALVQRYLLPRWGKLQAAEHHPRRRPRHDVAGSRRPVLANQVLAAASAIFPGRSSRRSSPPTPAAGRAQRDADAASAFCPTASYRSSGRRSTTPAWSPAPRSRRSCSPASARARCAHMRREHIKDGWWEMPGEPVPALGWPGTKNGESHRVWLPQAAQALLAELGDERHRLRVRRPTRSPGRRPRRRHADDLQPSSASSGRRRTICGGPTAATVTALGFGRDAMNRIQNHKEGGIASVYDRHGYADENKRVMEAVAAKIMALAEGRRDDKVVALKVSGRDLHLAGR